MSGTAVSERASTWVGVDPERSTSLVDARLQLHHAAQLATALGISYLEKQADDSHTNLEWLPAVQALASNRAGVANVRVAVRPDPLTLLILDGTNAPAASFALDGRTLEEAVAWVRARLAEHQLDAARYTTQRHYTIPPHPVEQSRAFDAHDRAAFAELAAWYADAALYFIDLSSRVRAASPVRCWPHHFDIGMLFESNDGKSIGVGLEPGDTYYAEPYWYANRYPAPDSAAVPKLPALDGGGAWHTSEWIGAALAGSRMTRAAADQRAQVSRFFDSAFRAYESSNADSRTIS
jgi:hypothetical protein